MQTSCLSVLCSLVKCKSRVRSLAVLVTALFLVLVSFFYYLPKQMSGSYQIQTASNHAHHRVHQVNFSVSDTAFGEVEYTYDSEHDVLVFLHIQKTGGSTFGRHLSRNTIGFPAPCRCQPARKRCDCRDRRGHYWLFSRDSAGWACGLHSDWTELHECIPSVLDTLETKYRKRRYQYITILRDPVQRYLSEWKHVQRGSTWRQARLSCNKRPATLQEVPFCYEGENWANVTLDEFMACPHNLATNRQTRMLANLSIVGCYNSSKFSSQSHRQSLMLNSAIENLRQLAFFGVLENQLETQRLFEWTFGVRFKENFALTNTTHAQEANVTAEQLQRIVELNNLDIALYKFAKQLFDTRIKKTGSILENPSGDLGSASDLNVVNGYDSGVEDDSYDDDGDNGISKQSVSVAKNLSA